MLQGQAPTAAGPSSLPYLEAIVLEALRLYSPAYMVGRCNNAPALVGGFALDAGTTVLVRCVVWGWRVQAEQPVGWKGELQQRAQFPHCTGTLPFGASCAPCLEIRYVPLVSLF